MTVHDHLALAAGSLDMTGAALTTTRYATDVTVGSGCRLIVADPLVGAELNVAGTVQTAGVDVAAVDVTQGGTLDSSATIWAQDVSVDGGTLATSANLTATHVDVINGGTLNVAGTLAGAELNVAGTVQTAGVDVAAVDVTQGGTLESSATIWAQDVSVNGGTLATLGNLTADTTHVVNGGTLNVGGTLAGGGLNVAGTAQTAGADLGVLNLTDGGELRASGDVTAENVNMTGGAVLLGDGADLHVVSMQVTGGTVNTGPGHLVVRESLHLGDGPEMSITDGTFKISGPNLPDQDQPRNLTLTGGDLTIGGDLAPPAGAIAVWNLEEGTGTVTADSSITGNDHLGTISGASWVTDAAERGTVVDFDGDDYVQAANAGDIDLGSPFTVGMWIKTSETGRTLLGEGQGDHVTHSSEKDLYIDAAGGQLTLARQSLFSAAEMVGTSNVADGRWHHVAVTYNGSTTAGDQEIYVDGVNDTAIRMYGSTQDGGPVVRLGWAETRNGDGHYSGYVGLMDEVYLYDRCLDAAEVAQLYEFGQVAISLENTNLSVTASSGLHLNTPRGDSTFGNLALDSGVILEVTGAPVSFHDVTAGDGSSIEGDLRVGGTLAPGEGPGTVDVTGDLEMKAGSTYEWELGASAADLVDVSGKLTLSSEGWRLKLIDDGAVAAGGDLPLFGYGGLAEDSLGAPAIDTGDVPHWAFAGGVPSVSNDAAQRRVVLTGLTGTSQWGLTESGLYGERSNWTDSSVPNGPDATANFMGKIAGDSTVTLESAVTVGGINFRNANSYTIDGETITLETSSGDAQINVLQGDHTILAPLALTGSLGVHTKAGTSLTLDPTIPGLVAGELTKDGPGTLVVASGLFLGGEIHVNQGVLQVGEDLLAYAHSSTRVIELGDGAALRARGNVSGRLIGGPGSTLEAIGTLEIGDSDDENGYAYRGALEVGPHMLGLEDADEAPLYGAHIESGTISTFNGLRLLPINMADGLNSRLYGYGTVNGNVVMGIEGNPTPAVVVADPGETMELTGVVQTGTSTFVNNVIITGTERLGFSPAVAMKLGGAPIGPDAVVEVYGDVGADFDQEIPDALQPPQADQQNGYGQFYVAGGESQVLGKITLTTGNSDYVG